MIIKKKVRSIQIITGFTDGTAVYRDLNIPVGNDAELKDFRDFLEGMLLALDPKEMTYTYKTESLPVSGTFH